MLYVLLISDKRCKKQTENFLAYLNIFLIFIIVLIKCFDCWHSCCIIITSGSFTLLCQPLRDVLHKLRMTHNKVPAVQLLILALLISISGRNVELGTALFHNKAGLIPALLYLAFPSVSIFLFVSVEVTP